VDESVVGRLGGGAIGVESLSTESGAGVCVVVVVVVVVVVSRMLSVALEGE